MIGSMTLSALSEKLSGRLDGADVEFSRLSTDTRTLNEGDVFLALSGERFDGNEFVAVARDRGASAAIVNEGIAPTDLPLLRVADTHAALARIANLNRRRASAQLIALTGSQGKTTVKEMIGAILSLMGPTLITHANLNNTIGVPLTLLRLESEHRFAVIEMGANCAGEIAFSATAAAPDIALITNASAAHLEGFGSLQGIVQAKGEIIDALGADGTVILNADDPNLAHWVARSAGRRLRRFSGGGKSATEKAAESANKGVEYRTGAIGVGKEGQVAFELITPFGGCDIELRLLGRHNIGNAVAAAAAALEAGASLESVRQGLQSVEPVAGRLALSAGPGHCSVIDDTYNASPESFAAAIDVLATFPGRRVLVAGDMKELAEESRVAHRGVGEYARSCGIEQLWAVGEWSATTVEAFGGRGRQFNDKQELLSACQDLADAQTVFLIKGSRGAGMDSVAKQLTADGGM